MSMFGTRSQPESPSIVTRSAYLSSTALLAVLGALWTTNAVAQPVAPTVQAPTPEDTDHIVSVDGLGLYAPGGGPKIGDGSGDLVLLVYDPSGKSPRKRSLLLDLSATEPDGSLNDLTANDVRNVKKRLSVSHPELDAFIARSKDHEQILWQVFAIVNHTTPNPDNITEAKLDFYGFVTSEAKAPKAGMPQRSIHRSRAYRGDLILSNIEYDIESNGAMESFTGEPPAYNAELHAMLNNGADPKGLLNQTLQLGAHLIELVPATKERVAHFASRYEKFGTVTLKYQAEDQQALLEFKLR